MYIKSNAHLVMYTWKYVLLVIKQPSKFVEAELWKKKTKGALVNGFCYTAESLADVMEI